MSSDIIAKVFIKQKTGLKICTSLLFKENSEEKFLHIIDFVEKKKLKTILLSCIFHYFQEENVIVGFFYYA